MIKTLSNLIQHLLNDNQAPNDQIVEVYAKTKEKFLELLMKRLMDKSVFCRTKVLKVFMKLTEENLLPRPMYLQLFGKVISMFKDDTVLVRKGALKLFGKMVEIFGMILPGIDGGGS